jgi:hypothetical protein
MLAPGSLVVAGFASCPRGSVARGRCGRRPLSRSRLCSYLPVVSALSASLSSFCLCSATCSSLVNRLRYSVSLRVLGRLGVLRSAVCFVRSCHLHVTCRAQVLHSAFKADVCLCAVLSPCRISSLFLPARRRRWGLGKVMSLGIVIRLRVRAHGRIRTSSHTVRTAVVSLVLAFLVLLVNRSQHSVNVPLQILGSRRSSLMVVGSAVVIAVEVVWRWLPAARCCISAPLSCLARACHVLKSYSSSLGRSWNCLLVSGRSSVLVGDKLLRLDSEQVTLACRI